MPPQNPIDMPSQRERAANADIVVIRLTQPASKHLIEELLDNVGPLHERVKEAYVAYDDGFGHIVRK